MIFVSIGHLEIKAARKGIIMFKHEILPTPVRRAALYIRVSTEEQAKKGYSLPAQKEDLEEYAKRNGYAIVDYYIDDGVSARKKYANRKELMRLLEDVQAGKIDVVLFIKLDRWFRSIADYYKIQEILDKHNVAWKTTQENYDTETTNGRLYINIRLSVAQDESDRTGDRIRFVNESKVARGEVISGSVPLGFKIQDKHLVHDPETVEAVRSFFHYYKENGSGYAARAFLQEAHGINVTIAVVRKMLNNTLYKGQYRDNPSYCEPIIPPDEFDEIHKMAQARSFRRNQTGRVYVFSGLLVCAECGRRMVGRYSSDHNRNYYTYRCQAAVENHTCIHRKHTPEKNLEEWLWLHMEDELDAFEAQWRVKTNHAPKPKADRAAILRKLDKLKELYINDLMTMEQYKADYEKYRAQLAQQPDTKLIIPNFARLRGYLGREFHEYYAQADRTAKRNFWHGFIEKIVIDADGEPTIFFKI